MFMPAGNDVTGKGQGKFLVGIGLQKWNWEQQKHFYYELLYLGQTKEDDIGV